MAKGLRARVRQRLSRGGSVAGDRDEGDVNASGGGDGGGDGGDEGQEPVRAQHSSVQRKLKKRLAFMDRVRQTALSVRAEGVAKRKRKATTQLDLSTLVRVLLCLVMDSCVPAADYCRRLHQDEALAGVSTAKWKSPFEPGSAKPVTAARRRMTVAAEASRLEAVLKSPSFNADPVAAVTHHILAALPPPAAPLALARKNRPGSHKRKARKEQQAARMQS